jgi:hypothetical protein
MRVAARIAELLGDDPLQILGDVVLEHLGLRVDSVPRHPERLREIRLQQPVMADHLQCNALAGGGERCAAIRLVLGEPELGETFDHRRDRAR